MRKVLGSWKGEKKAKIFDVIKNVECSCGI